MVHWGLGHEEDMRQLVTVSAVRKQWEVNAGLLVRFYFWLFKLYLAQGHCPWDGTFHIQGVSLRVGQTPLETPSRDTLKSLSPTWFQVRSSWWWAVTITELMQQHYHSYIVTSIPELLYQHYHSYILTTITELLYQIALPQLHSHHYHRAPVSTSITTAT